MKKLIFALLAVILLSSFDTTNSEKNQINEKEWESLFDGSTLNGWHRFNRKGVAPIWTAKDGVLTFDPSLRPEGDYVHDLVTDKVFKSFQLSIEWNISEGGNSGIFWGVQEGESHNKPYSTGPEIQVLDNELHPDAKANPKFHQAGALYDLVQPSKDVCKPAGEWNHVLLTIDYDKNEGSVELNGTKIVEFPLRGEEWDALVANSKFNDDCNFKRFGKFRTGKIGLQDHGDKVSFRNIKIREL
ncbi:MAG: 3-keto-disaccharide hydrolase [Flavobacteriaceae bacterium]